MKRKPLKVVAQALTTERCVGAVYGIPLMIALVCLLLSHASSAAQAVPASLPPLPSIINPSIVFPSHLTPSQTGQGADLQYAQKCTTQPGPGGTVVITCPKKSANPVGDTQN